MPEPTDTRARPAENEGWAYAAGNRLKRLCTDTLAALSHERVRILHRSIRDAFHISNFLRAEMDLCQICGAGGRFCSKWRSGQSRKIWGGASSTGGRGLHFQPTRMTLFTSSSEGSADLEFRVSTLRNVPSSPSERPLRTTSERPRKLATGGFFSQWGDCVCAKKKRFILAHSCNRRCRCLLRATSFWLGPTAEGQRCVLII